MSEKILVVAAHPDDELLGAGGTIAARVEKGDEAFALILGEGQTSRWESRDEVPQDVLNALHDDSLNAAKEIGFSKVLFDGFPDNRFDSVALLDIVRPIEALINDIHPNVVYTHHGGDLNIDHQRTFQAVLTATRPMSDCPVREVYAFETLSATEWNLGNPAASFVPNVFFDITGTIDRKCQGLTCYKTEMRDFPHPRSVKGVKALAAYRGATSGFEYAEAFQLVRMLRS